MERFVRAALLALAFIAPVFAADNPELSVRLGADAKAMPLTIGKLDVAVTVFGDTAHTVVTAEFLNPSDRPLEGDFLFDLPRGSVVTGYALDVHGAMIDGVLVGEREARVTYERAVRRGIDPGLGEVTRAGAFKTHVFPILAHQGRTVRLIFDTPIEPGKAFVLPFASAKPVGEVHYRVTTRDENVNVQGPEKTGLGIHRDGNGTVADGSAKNVTLSGRLLITTAPPPPLLLARHYNSVNFFEINDAVLPSPKAAAKPERVRIYWDSSLSRRDADLAGEIALAGEYIAATHPAAVDVVFFAAGTPQVRTFKAPKPEEIEAVLKVTDYQGGTSLKALFAADLPPASACVMFSDGNVTADSWKTAKPPCPLFAVSSAKDANRPLLALLTKKSGGTFVDLNATVPDAALASLMRQTPAVADVRSTSGEAVDYAVLPVEGNRIRIVGQLPDEGDLIVTLARSASPSRRYAVDRSKIKGSDTLGSLWALKHIDDMLADEHPDKEAVVEFSRRFSIASTGVSFVVFEQLSDYVDAGVPPPAGLGKEMLAQYAAANAESVVRKAMAERERLDAVVKLWDEEKKWWESPVLPKLRPLTTQSRVMAPPPPPPPPPSPAIALNAPAPTNSVETMVVTGARASGNAAAMETVVLGKGKEQDKAIAVKLAEWNPDRPYIKALTEAKPENWWYVYRDQEKTNGNTPAFYLDVAEFFFRKGRTADAIRIVLNALELPSANVATQTIVADRLMRYGDTARAAWLYERILFLEGDRPQPRRNLALALAAVAEQSAEKAVKIAGYQRALDLYVEIIAHDWKEDFNGIEVISLMEANRLVAKLKALGVSEVKLDKRLIALLDVDLRVVMEWNTDATDMDLWVDEPTGERCIYSHRETMTGGRLSNDMTRGYGPEEYLLHKAPNGTYTVRVNAYAADRLDPNGASRVKAHIFRNWGRADEQEQVIEIELDKPDHAGKNAELIGTVKVTGSNVKLPVLPKGYVHDD
jgi:hypothetical protein